MAEESGQDKTEEPTAQRLSKAREEGQIARSQELAPAAMMVMATLFFTMMGHDLFNSMGSLFKSQLSFDRRITDKAELLPAIFGNAMVDGFLIVLPLMAVCSTIISAPQKAKRINHPDSDTLLSFCSLPLIDH